MTKSQVESVIADLTSEQWGLVTTRQAENRGIGRVVLARMSEAGRLERLTQGVYRLTSTPATPFDELRALWLSMDPKRLAEERLAEPDIVVGGATAAWLHGVGDLQPTPYTFWSRSRRQSKRPDVRFRTRPVHPSDVTTVEGLPVTTVERTIADLLTDREDLSLVVDAFRDAATQGAPLNRERLREVLAPAASILGVNPGDGAAAHAALERRAGTDLASRLTTLARGIPVESLLGKEFLEGIRAHLSSTITPTLNSQLSRQVKTNVVNYPVLPPALIEALQVRLAEQIKPIVELSTKFQLSPKATEILAGLTLSQNWSEIARAGKTAEPEAEPFTDE